MRELRKKELDEIREAAERDRHEDPTPIDDLDLYRQLRWRLRLRTSAVNVLTLLQEIERLKGERKREAT